MSNRRAVQPTADCGEAAWRRRSGICMVAGCVVTGCMVVCSRVGGVGWRIAACLLSRTRVEASFYQGYCARIVCCGIRDVLVAGGLGIFTVVFCRLCMSWYAWSVGCWWSCVTAGCIWRVVYVVACTIRQMPAGLGFCGDVPQVVCVVGYVPRDSYDSTWVDRPSATVQWCQCEEWRRRCVKMGSHSDLGT